MHCSIEMGTQTLVPMQEADPEADRTGTFQPLPEAMGWEEEHSDLSGEAEGEDMHDDDGSQGGAALLEPSDGVDEGQCDTLAAPSEEALAAQLDALTQARVALAAQLDAFTEGSAALVSELGACTEALAARLGAVGSMALVRWAHPGCGRCTLL